MQIFCLLFTFCKLLTECLPQHYTQDAIANFTTENEIAASIKQKFEAQYPST
jgi:hypothetical protein